MAKVYAFLADGLEEVECLAVVDVLRRSGVEGTLVSVTGDRKGMPFKDFRYDQCK